MLNIRTIVLSVAIVAVLMLTVQLVTARTEIISDLSSDPVNVLDSQELVADQSKAPVPSYRSRLDECFDVPVAEAVACHAASQVLIPAPQSSIDECYDVSLSELASCRE